jgi:hypothetical protein
VNRAELIERSLRAFIYGWAGWVPFLGWPFVVLGWIEATQCRSQRGAEWNPAEGYLQAAWILLILSPLVQAVAVAIWVSRMG